MVQGGDFSEGNRRGGESIYGGFFEDESFAVKLSKEFLLSMANRGKDTNSSQFFIATKPTPHLDGHHVVFGQVISGQEVVREIENKKTDAASKPFAEVRILSCGELIPMSKVKKEEKKRHKFPPPPQPVTQIAHPILRPPPSLLILKVLLKKNPERGKRNIGKILESIRRRSERKARKAHLKVKQKMLMHSPSLLSVQKRSLLYQKIDF
jgi:cyclophilin family peptidyl-prolyl cis-trans isomerase